jgi:hypothetical protein
LTLKPLLFGTAFALVACLSPLALAQPGKDKTGTTPPANQTVPGNDQTANDDEGAMNLSDAELAMREFLTGANPQTLGILDDRFPDELNRLEQTLNGVIEGAQADFDHEAALEGFAEVIATERQSYVSIITTAPDAALQAAITSLRDFMQKVYDTEGPEICGRFANEGSSVLYETDIAEHYSAELDRQSALFLAAAADARDTPTDHGEASDADLQATFNKMLKEGGTQHQIDVLAAQDPTDPEVCPALINMLSALAILEGDVGARSRAYFLPDFVGY